MNMHNPMNQAPALSMAAPHNDKSNGFGALRLLFASLVIVSHAPEMATGDRSRELLTGLFGTMSFGEVAVDCFFLISGYLITASMLSNRQGYLVRRAVRIFPAYFVAYWICILLVAPLAGMNTFEVSVMDWAKAALRPLLLMGPKGTDIFVGTAYSALDGSMWTIPYEFRCYLLTYALGIFGFLGRPRLIVAITCVVLTAYITSQLYPEMNVSYATSAFIGKPNETLRLIAAYLVGASYRVSGISFRKDIALAVVPVLFVLMFMDIAAEPALLVLGGYILFTTALRVDSVWFKKLNARTDISYGVYLYAWPITALLYWYMPSIDIWMNAAITAVLSCAAGWCSWTLVEKPAMRLGRRRVASQPKIDHAATVS